MNFENNIGALQPIEQSGQLVLTTAQLADAYGTDSRRVSENFNANKDRYTEGKHFFLLEGNDLKQFGDQYGNSVSVSRVSKMYLWTEKGAWLHAKSLNTDQAWQAYEMLVDDYYSKKEQLEMTTERLTSMLTARLGSEVVELKRDVAELKEAVNERMTIDYGQQAKLLNEKNKRVETLFNGGQYDIDRSVMHRKAWSNFKKAFGVSSYRDTLAKDFDEAVAYLRAWRPLI